MYLAIENVDLSHIIHGQHKHFCDHSCPDFRKPGRGKRSDNFPRCITHFILSNIVLMHKPKVAQNNAKMSNSRLKYSSLSP